MNKLVEDLFPLDDMRSLTEEEQEIYDNVIEKLSIRTDGSIYSYFEKGE